MNHDLLVNPSLYVSHIVVDNSLHKRMDPLVYLGLREAGGGARIARGVVFVGLPSGVFPS